MNPFPKVTAGKGRGQSRSGQGSGRCNMTKRRDFLAAALATALAGGSRAAAADNRWEATRAGDAAVERGLRWLARAQGVAGNWGSTDLGLVSLGALAFLSAGHAPGRSPEYGDNAKRAIQFVLSSAKPSGLLNITDGQGDMYNHGLSVFVLSQCYGVLDDRRLGPALEKGLKVIYTAQRADGGWSYRATQSSAGGHDLSLTVMQAKALRAAMDMGLEVPPDVIARAIAFVRRCYRGTPDGAGAFTYQGDAVKPGTAAIAMAACGAVCLQEFGEYNDGRITRSLSLAADRFRRDLKLTKGMLPVNAYAMFYLAQGLYQVGGNLWRQTYPAVRDTIVRTQAADGSWHGGYRNGRPGQLFGTAVGVFALSIPNRYLPILQRGREDKTSGAAR